MEWWIALTSDSFAIVAGISQLWDRRSKKWRKSCLGHASL